MRQSRRSWLLGSVAGIGALTLGATWKNAGAALPSNEPARVIKIEAKKFSYTPKEITIRQGEQVVLELTSLDFVHGFNLPDFKIRADIPPGKVTTLALRPMETGRFSFLCDNFCGDGHETMEGTVIVV